MGDRVRVELPPRGEHLPHAPRRERVARFQRVHLQVEHARPAQLAQRRQSVRVLSEIAVVERHHNRTRRQRRAVPPVVVDTVQRDGVVPVLRKPVHLPVEVAGADEQVRKSDTGRCRRDHVVHQDRDGAIVSRVERDASTQMTTIGVNGDFFSWNGGWPSGLLMRGGVVEHQSAPGRAAVGIDTTATLHADRVPWYGRWHGADSVWYPVAQLNEPPRKNSVALFTPVWGGKTPSYRGTI